VLRDESAAEARDTDQRDAAGVPIVTGVSSAPAQRPDGKDASDRSDPDRRRAWQHCLTPRTRKGNRSVRSKATMYVPRRRMLRRFGRTT